MFLWDHRGSALKGHVGWRCAGHLQQVHRSSLRVFWQAHVTANIPANLLVFPVYGDTIEIRKYPNLPLNHEFLQSLYFLIAFLDFFLFFFF